MTRHIGAFILNTVIPIIDRIERLLEKHPGALDKIDVLVQMELDKVKTYCSTVVVVAFFLTVVLIVLGVK